MKWVSVITEQMDTEAAVHHCIAGIAKVFEEQPPDLVALFISTHHIGKCEEVLSLVELYLQPRHVIGCSGGGVIGAGTEIEQMPAISMTAALLPGVALQPFYLDQQDLTGFKPGSLQERLGLTQADQPAFLMLSDPFTFDIEDLLQHMDWSWPGRPKAGGLVSGGRRPGMHVLFQDGLTHRAGMVGLALSGALEMEAVVAQGCRPIGQPMFITGCRNHLLMELNGRPARQVLAELFESLAPEDQALFNQSLFLGLEMKQQETPYGQGDFLVRNILGLDPVSGHLTVGAMLQEEAVVQFHLRDAETSREDLELQLGRYREKFPEANASGALLFSCMGRGARLYGEPDHDSGRLRFHLGAVPVGGFFCNGEIGPVQGQTFSHAYTSCFAIFREKGR